jgi:hypothetical protein
MNSFFSLFFLDLTMMTPGERCGGLLSHFSIRSFGATWPFVQPRASMDAPAFHVGSQTLLSARLAADIPSHDDNCRGDCRVDDPGCVPVTHDVDGPFPDRGIHADVSDAVTKKATKRRSLNQIRSFPAAACPLANEFPRILVFH